LSDQSDPFATSVVDEDPFAEPTPDPQPEPADAPPEQAPPVVDREGQPAPTPDPAPEPVASAEAPAVQEPETPQAPQEAPQAPPQTPVAPPEPPATPAPAETPSPAEPQEPETEVPEGSPTPEAPGQTAAEAPDVPEAQPDAQGPRGGKAQMRYYKVLMQTERDQFTLIKLVNEDGTAKDHVVSVNGELYLEARNNEHAYKLAYHVVGRPSNGARVWPVPKASYRPRMVKPKPPEPERERLSIS
jgi:outer membrane biosynthesis protein TonB